MFDFTTAHGYRSCLQALSPDNVGRSLASSAAKFAGFGGTWGLKHKNHWIKQITLKIHNVGNPMIDSHLGMVYSTHKNGDDLGIVYY